MTLLTVSRIETATADSNRLAQARMVAGDGATLRSGLPPDAERAGTICYKAFQTIAECHRFPPDFPSPDVAIGLMEHLLSRPDIYSVVAESEGRLLGSNFLWESDEVAGVGPITVDPSAQNGSIGWRLMDAVLLRASQRNIEAVRLVQAAYHGRSLALYTKLGFAVREPLAVMQGPSLTTRISDRVTRTAVAADLEPAKALCRRVHGHHRGGELRLAIEQGLATVVEQKGRVTGYTTGIGFFGHAVGETSEDLKALIADAPSFSGPGFLLPVRNTELFRWCLDQGLRVVQPMTLMSVGPYQEPRGAFLPSILY